MAIESMLPRGGGGISDIVFNITTSPILASKTVTATDGVTTVTATTGVDGKATIKVKQGGTYTITCEGLNRKINAYTVGVYEVEISPSYKTLTFNGAVTLAPTMDRSKYTYAEDYNKPNSVDGFQVQAWSGDKLVGVEFFENETAVMTIDTRLYNEVTIKYSSEDGFTKPTDETVVLSTDKTLSPTWVEKYAVLEVTRASDLYSYDVEVKWGESADQKITYTEKDTDKSIFICKNLLTHTVSCGSVTPVSVNVNVLDGSTLPTVRLVTEQTYDLLANTTINEWKELSNQTSYVTKSLNNHELSYLYRGTGQTPIRYVTKTIKQVVSQAKKIRINVKSLDKTTYANADVTVWLLNTNSTSAADWSASAFTTIGQIKDVGTYDFELTDLASYPYIGFGMYQKSTTVIDKIEIVY